LEIAIKLTPAQMPGDNHDPVKLRARTGWMVIEEKYQWDSGSEEAVAEGAGQSISVTVTDLCKSCRASREFHDGERAEGKLRGASMIWHESSRLI